MRSGSGGSMEDGTSKDWSPERAREVEALMRLQCLPGVGTRTLWRILERFGSGVAALEAPAAQLRAVGARSAAADLGAPQLDDRLRGALARCARSDIDVLTWRDPGYPARLRQLADPPALLFCRGDPALLLKSSVTVVGSRRSTPYGRRVAETLAAELSVRGVVVVSGLALGIDGAAHRGALESGGDTIAVLGSGVDLIQPSSHRALGQRISREGLLVSEFLPGEPAQAHHFPRRNRILAALGGAVVVVEAGERSGAFITVEHALDLGRDVYAVPGPVDSPQSRGCNALLQQGAYLVSSVHDFVRELELPGLSAYGGAGGSDAPPAAAPNAVPGSAGPPSAGDRAEAQGRLSPVARQVWGALGDRPVRIEDLAHLTRLDPGRLLAVLTEFEVAGWVAQEAGMRFRKAS